MLNVAPAQCMPAAIAIEHAAEQQRSMAFLNVEIGDVLRHAPSMQQPAVYSYYTFAVQT